MAASRFVHTVTVIILTMTFIAVSLCHATLLDWLFGDTVADDTVDVDNRNIRSTDIIARSKRFEMLSTDDTFQSFAKSLSELTPLDECYHIVVFSLKKKCGLLSEEELGKLAVQLLNCQSEAEDRHVYPCTNQMTIKECTRSMDGTTWNAYQIVSNRARAMCYATQQHQFRKLTEITVSQLVTQANRQLDNMRQLQDGQEALHDVTADTMQKMYASQQSLMNNQEMLKSAQQDVYSHIASNLAQLSNEKALIASGNRELVDMTDNIRTKLDAATNFMARQETKQKMTHDAIISDLHLIREKAQKVMDKIDDSSNEMVQHHVDMLHHYQTTLENLSKINATINYLLDMIGDTRTRIGWLTQLMGGAEDKFGLLSTAVLHLVYFILAAISAAFLQTPIISRLIIMIIVPLNAVAQVKRGSSLDFTSMTLFILISVFVNWSIRQLYNKLTRNYTQPSNQVETTLAINNSLPSTPSRIVDNDDLRQLTLTVERLYHTLHSNITIHESGINESPIPPYTPLSTPSTPMPDSSTNLDLLPSTSQPPVGDISSVRRRLANDLDSTKRRGRTSKSRSPSRCSTPLRLSHDSRSSSRLSNVSTSSRPLCLGVTKSDQPCRNSSTTDTFFCHRHQP